MTKIISAFPCSGKSYICDNLNLSCSDSDSSKFSWILDANGNSTGVRNPDFPNNYKEHIAGLIGKVDFIFVSSHKEVRDMLAESGWSWISVMPDQSLMNEWIGRAFVRGSSSEFCKLLQNNWQSWVPRYHQMSEPNACAWLTLQHGEYISDHINWLSNIRGN